MNEALLLVIAIGVLLFGGVFGWYCQLEYMAKTLTNEMQKEVEK